LPVLPATVLVPEAPVNEDNLVPGAKDKVRIARQVPSVNAVTIAHSMNQAANDHLWFRVGITDA
jgi:hypothetical protein